MSGYEQQRKKRDKILEEVRGKVEPILKEVIKKV